MKTIRKYLLITSISICMIAFTKKVYGQFNNKINTRDLSNSKISELTGPLLISKSKQRDFKDILVKDISKATTKNMKVAGTYFSKKSQRKWKITPDRPFGSGNLGFSMYSGQLWREYFFIKGHLRGDEPVAYSGHISFDARQGKTYLIKIQNDGANGNVYIRGMAGSTPFKVYGQNGTYPILIEASESGKMQVAISARYRAGQNERYPEAMPVKEIIIDEL
jgi:hypothetical protein